MAVMARDAWTDERLDDLNKRVDGGLTEIRGEIRAGRKETHEEILFVRTDLKEETAGVKKEVAGVRSELGEVRREIGALNRTIHQFAFAMVGTVFLGFCGTIAALFSLT
jgi:hypothetical protein